MSDISKKVMLINTLPFPDYWEVQEKPGLGLPLALLALGTVLDQSGFEVIIIDPTVDRDYFFQIKSQLPGCLWTGLSVMTNGVSSALAISRYIKEESPNIPTVWGGVHPTLFIESVVEHEDVDYACWGEGEVFVLEFSEYLCGKREVNQVQGMSYMLDDNICFNPRDLFIDINQYGIPKYSLVDMEKYINRDIIISPRVKPIIGKFISINTGTGCPYKCSFCWNTHPSQHYRSKTIGNILEHIDYVVKAFNPDVIHFQDDLFFADKERFFRFLDHYEQCNYQFKWFTLCRVNYIHDNYINDDVCRRIKDHCLWLGFGVESGSEAIRKHLRKEVSEEQVLRAAELLGKHKIPTAFAFMTGLPFESINDSVLTIKLMMQIRKLHPESEFTYQYYRPYPGSPLYDEAVAAGFQPPKTLDDWRVFSDKTASGGIRLDIVPWFDHEQWIYFSDQVEKRINRKQVGLDQYFESGLLGCSFFIRDKLKYWENIIIDIQIKNKMCMFAEFVFFVTRRVNLKNILRIMHDREYQRKSWKIIVDGIRSLKGW